MNLDNYDKIEAYLFDLLDEKERATFEAELKKDDKLKAEVNLHRLEQQAIKLQEEQNLRAQFAEWKQEKKSNTEIASEAKVVSMKPTRRSLFYRLSAAASVLLVLSAGTFWWANTTYNNQALADAAFEFSSNDRSNASTATSDFELAEQAFTDGKHKEAIDIYQNIIETNSNPTEVHLAEWNLANVQLAAGNTATAKLSLGRIAEDEAHTYQEAAAELLPKLNSFWRKLTVN